MATVLVTGIGGNVGQGILRNIRADFPEIKLIGTDVANFTSGHHFCDFFYQVPYSYEDSFQKTFEEICKKEKVDLVIPSTDYEAHFLAKNHSSLPPLIASNSKTTGIFLDKLLTFQEFKKLNIPFTESILPSEFVNVNWEKYIVKPREGRGSRNIFINPPNPSAFDDSYVIQPLIEGKEITTAFYITKQNQLLGPITMERTLSAGMTNSCFTNNSYDEFIVKQIIHKLMDASNEDFKISGPCNIQAMVNRDGKIFPFEVNCRYSGTNSIRSQLGFKDVKYGIQEYLFNQEPEQPKIISGQATRIFMDIIYPGEHSLPLAAGGDSSFIF